MYMAHIIIAALYMTHIIAALYRILPRCAPHPSGSRISLVRYQCDPYCTEEKGLHHSVHYVGIIASRH